MRVCECSHRRLQGQPRQVSRLLWALDLSRDRRSASSWAGSQDNLLQAPRCADEETGAQGQAGLARPTLPGPTVLCEAFASLTLFFP